MGGLGGETVMEGAEERAVEQLGRDSEDERRVCEGDAYR